MSTGEIKLISVIASYTTPLTHRSPMNLMVGLISEANPNSTGASAVGITTGVFQPTNKQPPHISKSTYVGGAQFSKTGTVATTGTPAGKQ